MGNKNVQCKNLKLIEKRFLDLRNMFFNQETNRIFFSKQEIRLIGKSCPLCEESLLELRNISQNKNKFSYQEKPFLQRK